ncbi:MAG: hypothetical protein ABII20_06380 [Candidatus Omnitrophota bacterium]
MSNILTKEEHENTLAKFRSVILNGWFEAISDKWDALIAHDTALRLKLDLCQQERDSLLMTEERLREDLAKQDVVIKKLTAYPEPKGIKPQRFEKFIGMLDIDGDSGDTEIERLRHKVAVRDKVIEKVVRLWHTPSAIATVEETIAHELAAAERELDSEKE